MLSRLWRGCGLVAVRLHIGQASCVLAMGAGHATAARRYRESDTVLMVGVCGRAPTDAVFT